MPRQFFAVLSFLIFASAQANPAARIPEPKEFDRLDGRGATRKKVDVVEWEKNLEIHVYPKGSLTRLGLKIDRESKTTKNAVMVIEYGFQGVPYTMIRRAMLTLPLTEPLLAFRDESAADYDKIVISNLALKGMPRFTLAAPPAQLYPDHYQATPSVAEAVPEESETAPAATARPASPPSAPRAEPSRRRRRSKQSLPPKSPDSDSEGAIKSFSF